MDTDILKIRTFVCLESIWISYFSVRDKPKWTRVNEHTRSHVNNKLQLMRFFWKFLHFESVKSSWQETGVVGLNSINGDYRKVKSKLSPKLLFCNFPIFLKIFWTFKFSKFVIKLYLFYHVFCKNLTITGPYNNNNNNTVRLTK